MLASAPSDVARRCEGAARVASVLFFYSFTSKPLTLWVNFIYRACVKGSRLVFRKLEGGPHPVSSDDAVV